MVGWIKFLGIFLLLYGWYSSYLGYEEHTSKIQSMKMSQIPGLKKKIKQVQAKINEVEKFRGQIEEYESSIVNFEDQISKIKLKIPAIDDKTTILDELSNEAKKLNIQKVEFNPKYERENGGGIYLTNGIEFKGLATYLQFLVFFEKLSEGERLYNIASIKYKQSKDKKSARHNPVEISTIIETFHYNGK